MSNSFTLHGSPHSLPTYRVALMLRLCHVGFAFRYVSFQRGMHLAPEFRALSRWGQVPVLEHEGRVLVQSAVILEYLADTLSCFNAEELEARQHVRECFACNRSAGLARSLQRAGALRRGGKGVLDEPRPNAVISDH
jgi:glutathione S-transferase